MCVLKIWNKQITAIMWSHRVGGLYETQRRWGFKITTISWNNGPSWVYCNTIAVLCDTADQQVYSRVSNPNQTTQHSTYPQVLKEKLKLRSFPTLTSSLIHPFRSFFLMFSFHPFPSFSLLPPIFSLINTSPLTANLFQWMRKDTGILLFTSCCTLSEHYTK